ncbi:MAG: shikimate dehydrogenase [Thiotrichaceae bacterium]|nr:shikimate dehydrogenase [Thiotrichaceae bacterium]
MMDRYAVFGNPIAHSKSPKIHSLFAKQTAQNLSYEAILAATETGAFEKAVLAFQAAGGKGLNVTVPFKQAAWALATQRTPRAERAGAVNTLWFDEKGACCGDNTDGVGLVRDLLENHKIILENQRVLILGAGGAVRGILEPILAERPSACVIANRTLSKAQELVKLFPERRLHACEYAALAGQNFDVVINGTSASLQGEVPPLPENLFSLSSWAYDLMYAATATPFMTWAQTAGAGEVRDGLGMLVEQAAEAFYLWRGVRPETASVIAQLRAELHGKSEVEIGGRDGLEPTRFGDWEKSGRCIDF